MNLRKRQDLLFKAEILAGLRYDQRTVSTIFEEAGKMFMLEQSTTYQRVLEKGIEQGLEKGLEQGIEQGQREGNVQGQIQALQEAILETVSAKFGRVPRPLRSKVSKLDDPSALKDLLKAVAMAQSLKQL